MIEVKTKDEVKVEEELKYPVIMVSKYDGTKVLFTDKRSGTVLDIGVKGHYHVGYYSVVWSDADNPGGWEVFTGTLELSNKL